jgi:hypothetical protein
MVFNNRKSKEVLVAQTKQDPNEKFDIVIPDPADNEEPVDFDDDIVEVLRRYESIYCAFMLFKVYPAVLKKPLELTDIGKNIQDSLVDYCCAFAMLGERHVERIQTNIQYTVLQSALILTISTSLYIQLPDIFQSDYMKTAFSAICGFAAFQQLIVIIGCTIISSLLNRPYAYCDGTLARVKAFSLLIIVTIVNYVANLATMIAMLVAGFARSVTDGAIQLYSVVLVVAIIHMFVNLNGLGERYQDTRALRFYLQYCDPMTGRLKEEYLKVVYMPQDDEDAEGKSSEE